MSSLDNRDVCSAKHFLAQDVVEGKSISNFTFYLVATIAIISIVLLPICSYIVLDRFYPAIWTLSCSHTASIEYAACSLLHGDEAQREAAKQVMAILER